MQMNTAMVAIYDKVALSSLPTLSGDLSAVLSQGFIVADDCVFLKSLYLRRGNAIRANFIDEVGFEVFVNHLHIDGDTSVICLALAIRFLNELRLKWAAQKMPKDALAILSIDESDCVLRFHVARPGQSWIKSDLESYKSDAVLVVNI